MLRVVKTEVALALKDICLFYWLSDCISDTSIDMDFFHRVTDFGDTKIQ